jgi:hypothetical protein
VLYGMRGKEAMCVEDGDEDEQFVDPGKEKGGCKCNPL